jgi:hemerythrin
MSWNDEEGRPPGDEHRSLPEFGHEAIDRQHRVLLRRFANCQRIGRTVDLHRLLAELWFIERYAVDHFASEEQVMEESHYPEAPRHLRRHRQFTARMGRLRQDVAAGRHAATAADFDWVRDWFERHIFDEDLRLKRHLETQARPCAARAELGKPPNLGR